MQCPTCQNAILKPTKLTGGLPAEGCQQCNGALVSLWVYRELLNRHPQRLEDLKQHQAQAEEVETVDVKNALFCPKCSSLMTKYRMSIEAENRLDLCSRCNETWLNHGEWELINALNLTDKLTAFFNDSWQKNIQHQQNESRKEEKFKQIFAEDYAELKRMRLWINEHDKRQSILDYLNFPA